MCDHHHEANEPRIVDLATLDRRTLIRGLSTGTLLIATAGCAVNPVTGRSQLVGLADESALIRSSEDAWAEMKAKTPISRDPTLNRRLTDVGLKIASVSQLPNQSWEFVVFDSNERNAFVLPGGKVGFYKGLMEICDKDAHIATVVGHEVGHVSARHVAERYSQTMATQVGLAVGGAVLGSAIKNGQTRNAAYSALGLGAQVGILLPFSRQQESEADRVGVDYMYAAGYDVRESLVLWQRMAQGSGARQPVWLSTHPDPLQRMEALRGYINNRGYAVV